MQLPNVSRARVERSKIVEYLLNEDHPDGRSKAHFFQQFGFRARRWSGFAEALRNHAMQNQVQERAKTPFGTRYVVDGPIESPDGRNPTVRTVWVIENVPATPRLITAYPIDTTEDGNDQ